ncbi:DUF5412 family protein [Pseudobacillus wudalianchiensis]|uniref:Uncharacterized protein n=1 Tax=Pseudobacillus wudalianchiensis TaxID=1743143 RepID=A0A1B9B951_9BACI|nr:DUF5412 family protein [Bacillus wudalianchiensis]OCA92610.1 hypothetical protein A8F95_02635 [Bacillus wudalianchiensis]
MVNLFNKWAFYLSLLWLILSIHLVYSSLYVTWSYAPPSYVLWFLSVLTLILGLIGFKDKTNSASKLRSWFTVIISSILALVLFLGVIRLVIISEEKISSTHSPDGKYTINLYLVNGGATTAYEVLGVIDGPLWFSKKIYNDYRMDQADVEWKNNYTIAINGHILNLKRGETYSD